MDKLGFSKWSKKRRNDEVGGVVLTRGNDKLEIAFLGNQDLYFILDNYEQRKDFVVGKIGNEFVIPLLGQWKKFEDIDFDHLPKLYSGFKI